MRKVPSPALTAATKGASSAPAAGPSSWTTSTISLCRFRSSCCARCRRREIERRGWGGRHQRGSAGHRRDQGRSAGSREAGAFPRGSVLPPEHRTGGRSRRCASAGTTFTAGSALPAKHAPRRPDLKISAAALQRLSVWSWPGNVRELENCVQRLVALSRSDHLDLNDLPAEYLAGPTEIPEPMVLPGTDESTDLEAVMRSIECDLLCWALEQEDRNQSRAAARLGLARSTFCSRLKKHGLLSGE